MSSVFIKEETRQVVEQLLLCGKSFMLFRLPGSKAELIYTQNSNYQAFVAPWRTSFDNCINIIEEKDCTRNFVLPQATDKNVYLAELDELIEKLKHRGQAKTVISRVIRGCNKGINWVKAAEKLWTRFPDTFGYLFYTPKTGGWLGATPEKLLFASRPLKFSTIALAGTLPVEEPWNDKNYEEQAMVTEFIKSVLDDNNAEYTMSPVTDLKYGKIKHLATHFTGSVKKEDDYKLIINSLSPTPALSGFPIDVAFKDIENIEQHNRSCYGGYILIKEYAENDKNHWQKMYSFVTIRCAQFDPITGEWAVFAGGGITPKSNADIEWLETEAKASTLVDILSK